MLRALHPELMRTTRERPELELNDRALHSHDARFGHALLPARIDIGAAFSSKHARLPTLKLPFRHARFGPKLTAGMVVLAHGTSFKRPRERAVRVRTEREKHESRNFLVQAMDRPNAAAQLALELTPEARALILRTETRRRGQPARGLLDGDPVR